MDNFTTNNTQQLFEVRNALNILIKNSQSGIDETTSDLRGRLVSLESKAASEVILRYSQLNLSSEQLSPDLRQLAQDCLRINSTRVGLLRGPLSPISVNKPQAATPSVMADFFDTMCLARNRIESLIASP